MIDKDKIQCGKCNSIFFPVEKNGEKVYKCPMCGFGRCTETLEQKNKRLLLESN